MFETTLKLKCILSDGTKAVYEYNGIKSAVRIKGKYKSFMRTYGVKRTKDEAIALVAQWESENPLQYKTR